MRALPLLPALVAAVAAAPLGAPLGAQPAGRVALRAENPLPFARLDEVVSLPWGTVTQQLPSARPERVRVLDAAGREIPSQVVDNESVRPYPTVTRTGSPILGASMTRSLYRPA